MVFLAHENTDTCDVDHTLSAYHGWISCNLYHLNQLSTTLPYILKESVLITMICNRIWE